MNMRDAQILNARKKNYYCNLLTQVHHGCEHGESMLSSELPRLLAKGRGKPRERRAPRAEQYARYIDCGPSAWDDRD